MKFVGRPLKTYLTAVFQPAHYHTLWRMFLVYPQFVPCLLDYIFGTGKYPRILNVRFAGKTLSPMIYSHADLLTVNEIFCRQDYKMDGNARIIVDIGANIGISALYFLSKSSDTRCYLYEPLPRNVERLQENLRQFVGRYELSMVAVADREGPVRFGIESTGRYGGIGRAFGEMITVQCRHINDVLSEVLEKEQFIDLLKIDTEGWEEVTVQAISPELRQRIGEIIYEGPVGITRVRAADK